MAWIGAAVGGALSLIGGQSAQNNSAKSLRRQMRFQEYMSNTAHTREVHDLRNAGLNPILSANKSGASTPSGGALNYDNVIGDAVSTALQARRLREDVKTAQEQQKLLDSQKQKTDTEAKTAQLLQPYQESLAYLNDKITNLNVVAAEKNAAKDKLELDLYNSDVGPALLYAEKLAPLANSAVDTLTNFLPTKLLNSMFKSGARK